MNDSDSEPRWVPLDTVVAVNSEAVATTGEPFQVRDAGLLESALARCQNKVFYENERDVILLAVDLMLGIARNHPFIQGNKRTAFITAIMFIESNGYVCDTIGTLELGQLVIDVLNGDVPESTLIAEFRSFTRLPVTS